MKDIYDVFGNPGTGKVDKKWERANMVLARDIPLKGKLYCHRLAEPYIREGLRRAEISCPDHEVTRLGCFNFRHQRHDPKRPLSMHSWGIALDINPQWNKGVYFKRGEAPEAWSEAWEKIWPHGLPKAFVQAMQSVGFASGMDWNEDGRTNDHRYIDPMHMELRDRSN
jgi:hypothetical protein